jgi:hypothetical protein
MPTTCSARPNAHGAYSWIIHLRWCTSRPSQIPCGHALSSLICTSATVHLAVRLVSPVAFRSPSSRHKRPTRPSSVSLGALPLPKCMTNSVASSAKKRSALHIRGVMVGYLHDAQGYRVYNLVTGRITTPVHVVYQEDMQGFIASRPIDSLVTDA